MQFITFMLIRVDMKKMASRIFQHKKLVITFDHPILIYLLRAAYYHCVVDPWPMFRGNAQHTYECGD